MSLVPLFDSPCDLGQRLPAFVGDFLDLETSLRRRFREDSVTDLIIAAMLRLADPNLFVFVPENEAVTGNDFDIIIFDPLAREAIQYRIQAKRLKPHPTNWMISSYAELAHPNGTGAQSISLIKSAAAETLIRTIPLYAFYNPARTCSASGGLINGIELADGNAVRTIVRQLIRAKPKRPPLKRISTLQPLFFPFATILCPQGAHVAPRSAPRPLDSVAAVSSAIDDASERFSGTPPAFRSPLLSDLRRMRRETRGGSLQLKDKLPPILQQTLDRRSDEKEDRIVPSKFKRTRVVLLSQGPSRE